MGYLKNQQDYGTKYFSFLKTTELSNLGGINSVLGSTRLNYSITVQNTVLNWGYNFNIDPDNAIINLDIHGGGYAENIIYLINEYYNTSIAGELGKGKIGMRISNDFKKEKVFIEYYTDFEETVYKKELYEITTLDAWGQCNNLVNCFVSENDDYCPYVLDTELKTNSKTETIKNENYKDTSLWFYTQRYLDKLCTYAHYLYGIEENTYSFISSLNRTL